MRALTAGSPPSVRRLKIQLRGVKPAVWRRLEIASDTKLPIVSRALIEAMGWTDTHLHAFRVGRETYGVPDHEFPNNDRDERRFTLAQLAPSSGERFTFDYDFGDGWEHDVVIEAIDAPVAHMIYPRCVAGKRACPPEDCGGPMGYANFLEALADPGHDEHKALFEWAGPFDPEAFDIRQVNERLAALSKRRSRLR